MGKDSSRRAKVTPETREESARLKRIWDDTKHPSQAEFGEIYSIGNQSAVGQFLRGEVPLSLKAASGFARGLGCRIEDFSTRLAAEAASFSPSAAPAPLPPEIAELAESIATLPAELRSDVLDGVRHLLRLAHTAAAQDGLVTTPSERHTTVEEQAVKKANVR